MQLSKLKLNDDNPRQISAEKLNKLKQSVNDFQKMLDLRPIVVDANMNVLGGNMRVRALRELGWKEVPDNWVKVADTLTEEEKREFIIKDNIGFGDWDWNLLEGWDKEELEEWGMEIPDGWGGPTEGQEDDYKMPDEIETDIKLGDLIEIGPHRLVCGDATKDGDVVMLMDGVKADMVFTDPPYGMYLNTDWSSAKSRLDFASEKRIFGGKKHDLVIGDHDDFDPKFISSVQVNFQYCSEVFMWGADYYSEHIHNKNDGSWIVWDKRLDESADKMYGSCFELCWSKKKHKREIARIKWAGIFGTESEHDKRRSHPTQKPSLLAAWFFQRWGDVGDVVADVFIGSGSTMIAAHQLDRICYGMEIEPKYCQVTTDRMLKLDPDLDVKINGKSYVTKSVL